MYTSTRIRRTQSFCFAQFTQQISTVSTEQYQAGVKSRLIGFRVKTSDRGEVRSKRKRTATQKCEADVNSLVQTPRSNDGTSGNRLREQRQGFGTLLKNNLREFVKMQHS